MSPAAHRAEAAPLVDMERVFQIESSLNPQAHNRRSGAIGLGQITPVVVQEWNRYHKELPLTSDDLWNPDLNREVATWYMTERIPAMLRAFKLPVTTDNMLWAYNAGIGRVRQGRMPAETRGYLRRYHGLAR